MLEIEHEESWGDRVRLALCSERYEEGGGLAVLALDATDPDDEDGFPELWETLTVNLPENADAVAWRGRPGGVALNANGLSRQLARTLLAQGVVELSGDFVVRVLLLPACHGRAASARPDARVRRDCLRVVGPAQAIGNSRPESRIFRRGALRPRQVGPQGPFVYWDSA